MKKLYVRGWAVALTLLGLADLGQGQTVPMAPGQVALDTAAKQQKYLFVLLYKQDDAATQAMRKTLAAALASRSSHAASVFVQTTDPAEKALIDRWNLSRSPTPLVLAIAPNGAITGGFPVQLTEQDIAGAFVSPGMAACLKAAQARKLVLLCVQTAGSAEIPGGVRDFKADAQYGPATEVITVRADDAGEADLLKALQIRPKALVTAFITPPGNLLGTFDGSVTRQQLIERLQAAQTSCCPGGKCGPGGCCPGGKCEPKK